MAAVLTSSLLCYLVSWFWHGWGKIQDSKCSESQLHLEKSHDNIQTDIDLDFGVLKEGQSLPEHVDL